MTCRIRGWKEQQRLRETEFFLENMKIFSNTFFLCVCVEFNEIICRQASQVHTYAVSSNLFGHCVWIQILSLVHEGRNWKQRLSGKPLSPWASVFCKKAQYLEGLSVTHSGSKLIWSKLWPHSWSRITSTLSWTPWRSNSPWKLTTFFLLAAFRVPTKASKMLAQRSSLNRTPNFTLVWPSASEKESSAN